MDVALAQKPGTGERTVYEATGGRKTSFSFAFLLLLPFFASLPGMLYQRLSGGLWVDTVGLMILAAAFTIVMFLLFIELLFSLRARVEIGDKAVKLTLPAGRGPTPMLRYATHEIPYDQIKAVETRREIYGGAIAPVLLQGARIITKDDRAIRLGYVNESNVDPCLPYPVIARQIAERAGVVLNDRGSVWRSYRRKLLGLKSMDDGMKPIDEAQIAELNRSHRRWVTGVIALVGVLMVVGIVKDLITA
jgi:hypothetical protein